MSRLRVAPGVVVSGVGMAALDRVDRRNRFLPALRRLALVDAPPVAAA